MRYISAIVITLFVLTACSPQGPPAGTYTDLANCLSANGAVMYGAFWCPKCSRQKKAFGDAAELIPYVECDPRGDDSQTDLCLEKNVMSYPHWEFADGSFEAKVFSPEELAQRTGCKI